MKGTATQTTICRQLVAKTKLDLTGEIQGKQTIFKCEESVNLAHYFPYDVKLRLLAHSRSFLGNQKARNAIVGAENLLNIYSAGLGLTIIAVEYGSFGKRPLLVR